MITIEKAIHFFLENIWSKAGFEDNLNCVMMNIEYNYKMWSSKYYIVW